MPGSRERLAILAGVAQSVERALRKRLVTGSSPVSSSIALLVMLFPTGTWVDLRGPKEEKPAGCTRCFADVELGVMMCRGTIYAGIVQW